MPRPRLTRRRPSRRSAGRPTPKAAPPTSSKTPTTRSQHRLRGRSGRGPGKGTGPADRVRAVRVQSLVPGLLRGDFDFAMNGLEVTPDRVKAVRFSRPVLRLHAPTRRPRRRPPLRYPRAMQADQRDRGHAGRHGRRAAAGPDGNRQEELSEPGRAVPRSEAGPHRRRAPGPAHRRLLRQARPGAEVRRASPSSRVSMRSRFARTTRSWPTRFDAAIGRLLESGRAPPHLREVEDLERRPERLLGGETAEGVVQESARKWTFRRYFPLLWRAPW